MLFTCKGPLPNTLDDFWRMIWEQKIPTVVMLTNCFEDRVTFGLYSHLVSFKLTHSIAIMQTSIAIS